ncbi:MAG: hypothetical protein J7J57_01740 [Caldisericaceae bacterium]|nr:hypothetical protein [Caldisericaceae bacterium]
METIEYFLIIVNLIVGFSCAIILARFLNKTSSKPKRILHYFVILIAIYFIECVAMVMGMGIPVFSVILAFVWGIVFGLRFRISASKHNALKASFLLSLYSSFPAASFIFVPFVCWASGWNVLSIEEGIQFGIPAFLHLPWPLNTILGFYLALTIGAVLFKTVITTGEVSLFIHYAGNHNKET